MLNSTSDVDSTEHEISTAYMYRQINRFLALDFSDVVFILLKIVEMPSIVGILTFTSRINFVLSESVTNTSLTELSMKNVTSVSVVSEFSDYW